MQSGGEKAASGIARLLRNFGAHRAPVGVALACVAMLALAGPVPAWAWLLAIACIVAAGALARPSGAFGDAGHGPREGGDPLEQVSARRLADAVKEPLIVFDASGSTVHANAAATAAFGAIAPGTPLQLRFRAPEMQALFQSLTAGEAVTTAIDYAEKVPFERLYRVIVTPLDTARRLHVIAFADNSEARRIDRMRADFIANASHELRTPLASVSGFIETLRWPARDDPEARERFLAIMEKQAARMARLIDDLLSLSRLEMKPLTAREAVDLAGLLDGVIDSHKHLAAESGVVIEKEFGTGPTIVSGSRDELFQVFENLLENACKYGQAGGRVVVELAASESEVRATVRDFGPGIAAEHIPRITERFYRVDVDSSRSQKGTGLGLSIVKHILNRHGGWLSIRSQPGQGAEFTAHLPREATSAAMAGA
jgi:two-component system, OmpR family, phosphate regulon sensor histidine kinase PhoR